MKNRYGIFYFQYRIPSKFLTIANSRKLFRVSLRTRVRRDALKQARKLRIIMDELARKYFNSPEAFGQAMELLMEYEGIADATADWETAEKYLMQLDECQDRLLFKAIDFNNAKAEASDKLREETEFWKKTCERLISKESSLSREDSGNNPAIAVSAPLLSKLVEDFINDGKSRWEPMHWESNERDIRPKLETFIEIVGDRPANELKKEDVARYKTVLLCYPVNRKKKKEYRDLSIEQILSLQLTKEQKLSSSTVHDHSVMIRSFLGWCCDQVTGLEQDLKNPLKKIGKKTEPDRNKRHLLSDDDLKKLFESTEYIEGSHRKPSHYWVPLLGLFTGARLTELCQLYKADVSKDAVYGRWVISFNSEDDKKQKKLSHQRIVPVHKQLINLGFIDFVEAVATERLFNELPKGRDGYGDAFSKWFNTTYRGPNHCNVGQADEEKKNFHSFRHNFITQLQNKHRIDQTSVARLVGQEGNDKSVTTGTYTKDRTIEENYEIINKLTFPIDFTKIQKWKDCCRKIDRK